MCKYEYEECFINLTAGWKTLNDNLKYLYIWIKLTKKEVFDTKYIYFIVIIIYVDIQVRLYEMNA